MGDIIPSLDYLRADMRIPGFPASDLSTTNNTLSLGLGNLRIPLHAVLGVCASYKDDKINDISQIASISSTSCQAT